MVSDGDKARMIHRHWINTDGLIKGFDSIRELSPNGRRIRTYFGLVNCDVGPPFDSVQLVS